MNRCSRKYLAVKSSQFDMMTTHNIRRARPVTLRTGAHGMWSAKVAAGAVLLWATGILLFHPARVQTPQGAGVAVPEGAL